MDMKFEVAVLPVADVDRAKAFYQGLGWRLDADINVAEDYRVVQFTPPDSPASIQFGKGITTMTPGSVQNLMLIAEAMGLGAWIHASLSPFREQAQPSSSLEGVPTRPEPYVARLASDPPPAPSALTRKPDAISGRASRS